MASGARAGFGADLKPSPFKVAAERAPDQRVIICDEYPQRPCRSLSIA